jgi:hypothetical protein
MEDFKRRELPALSVPFYLPEESRRVQAVPQIIQGLVAPSPQQE